MKHGAAVVWLHRDLRLRDNPALAQAVRDAERVTVAYIHAPDEQAPFEPGAASNWWLHYSLESLDAELRELGGQLVLRRGPSLAALESLLEEHGATAVYWNHRYEPALLARDRRIKATLRERGLVAQSVNGALLNEPWEVENQSGAPYRVFTPYYRAAAERPVAQPLGKPKSLQCARAETESLSDFGLRPKLNWADGFRKVWTPGEAGARRRLSSGSSRLDNYAEERDRPDVEGTSRLSPHLAFGEVSVRQCYHRLVGRAPEAWIRQLYWREFAYHLLFHFPETTSEPLNESFRHFPWRRASAQLKRWQAGQTGVSLVDAGMRELWQTGWMHNRVRMVAGSFLVKHLLLPWQDGAAWFWDTLVDADLANNTLGWQWVAGSGADAAPYFRVFNPELQQKKFDPSGNYVARYEQENDSLLARRPVVELSAGRKRALVAYEQMKQAAARA